MTTETAAPSPDTRRGRWRIFVPTLLLLIAGLGWTGFWFWASARAEEAVDVWLAREAKLGRVYACGERHVGGYPFRIELECRNPSARIAVEGGEATGAAPRFLAVAQIYDPKRLIGELTGPVALTGPDGRKADLSFADAMGSAKVEGRRFERGSLEIKSPRLTTPEGEIGTAAELTIHVRRAPDAPDGTYDLAAAVDQASSSLFDSLPVGSGPVSVEFQARADGLEDFRPGPSGDRLKAFADAGGRVKVALARIARGDVAAEARGEAGLDQQGRIDGSFDVTARGVDELVKSFAGGEERGGLSSLIGVGAKMLGKPAELDGQAATVYRVALDKGRVRLGPFKLTRLPPAF